jgi:peptidoglycan hydrolase-like protein with peptidoglycan-binding domain
MLQSLLFFANDDLQRAALNAPPLARGSQGNAVRCLQLALASLGYSLPISVKLQPISADGVFGSETEQAVFAFQTDQGLQADGIAGMHTLSTLDQRLLTGQQDPLLVALKDLGQLGGLLVQAYEIGPALSARRAFEDRLHDLDGLVLGNPLKLAVYLKNRYPYLV